MRLTARHGLAPRPRHWRPPKVVLTQVSLPPAASQTSLQGRMRQLGLATLTAKARASARAVCTAAESGMVVCCDGRMVLVSTGGISLSLVGDVTLEDAEQVDQAGDAAAREVRQKPEKANVVTRHTHMGRTTPRLRAADGAPAHERIPARRR